MDREEEDTLDTLLDPERDYSASVKVLVNEMDGGMTQDAIDLAMKAFKHYQIEREVAKYLKAEFDTKYSRNWHCVVGRSYGSWVTNQVGRFIFFKIERFNIMLYKASP